MKGLIDLKVGVGADSNFGGDKASEKRSSVQGYVKTVGKIPIQTGFTRDRQYHEALEKLK